METPDHALTKSFSFGRESRAYHARQGQLIAEGKWAEAIQMDIDDVRGRFGSKYDKAIEELLGYYEQKGLIQRKDIRMPIVK